MENIIDKIVDIDKKALDIKTKTEKMLQENGKRLNKKLAEIEKKELDNAKKAGEKEYEKLIKQGKHKSNEIKLHTKKECEKLEESYTRIHKKLEKEILTQILISLIPKPPTSLKKDVKSWEAQKDLLP